MPDQEEINHQLKLLQTYRDNLRHALNQQGHFGALTPAMVINDIRESRQNIRTIKATLKKWNTPFEDLVTDEEQSAPPPPTTAGTPTQSPDASSSRQPDAAPVDFLIITPLREERNAVLALLPGNRQLASTDDDNNIYYTAELPARRFDNTEGTYKIIVLMLGKIGRKHAALATGQALTRWRPKYVLLVGIAGGVPRNDVAIGDIIIADQVVDYEVKKSYADGDKHRYEGYQVDPRMLKFAQNFDLTALTPLLQIARPDAAGQPTDHFGPVACGDTVIANPALIAELLDDYPKLIGVEMEAGGVALAAFDATRNAGMFMVRGVSDLADTQQEAAETRKWRAYACAIAATYTIAMLKSGPISFTTPQASGPIAAPTGTQASTTPVSGVRSNTAKARYLATQREKLDAAFAELESADEVRKVGLWKQIERLEQEIAKLERELQ